MRVMSLLLLSILLSACSSTYKNKDVEGGTLPALKGQTLEKQSVNIPSHFQSPLTLLLIGYKQNTQFDIDRWLIGLDMTNTSLPTYEIPAIQGLFPRLFKKKINNGMRAGIPEDLWQGVITLYEDGETLQAFTGNERPNNARILLINRQGDIVFFYDRGFSVGALNALKSVIATTAK